MNLYESTEQLLVDLIDYYEIMRFEAASFQDHDCSDEVIRYDGVVSNLKSTLNLVISHHQSEIGSSVRLPKCTRERQEED